MNITRKHIPISNSRIAYQNSTQRRYLNNHGETAQGGRANVQRRRRGQCALTRRFSLRLCFRIWQLNAMTLTLTALTLALTLTMIAAVSLTVTMAVTRDKCVIATPQQQRAHGGPHVRREMLREETRRQRGHGREQLRRGWGDRAEPVVRERREAQE